MGHRGRKPLALGHIDRLSGSPRAKERMTVLFASLQPDGSALEARRRLGLSESQFHQLRHQWLQASLETLEPRAPGRPPHVASPAEQRVSELEQEVRQLQHDLVLAQARCDVLAVTAAAAPEPKKGTRYLLA